LRAYNAAKCDYGRGSTPDPAGGASAFPIPLAGFKGAAAAGRGGKGKEGEEQGGRGRGWEVDSDASWNRAADWLRQALDGLNLRLTTYDCRTW